MPDKVRELQRLWLIEATRYNVLPLDDRLLERFNPDLAGSPAVLIEGQHAAPLRRHGAPVGELASLSIKNKSYSVTAKIVVPEKGAEGVIIAQGANIGGWSLYAKGGKLKYCYNWGGFKHFMIEATTKIPAGEHQVRMEFAYDGGGLGKGGTVTLYTDGKKVGEGKVDATLTNVFSADDGCDVGEDTGAPVSPDYGREATRSTGKVKGVQLAIAEAAEQADHLVRSARALSASRWRGSRACARAFARQRLTSTNTRNRKCELQDKIQRSQSADSRHPALGPDHVRREGQGHEVPAYSRPAAAEGRAQRARDPDRRRRLRRHERLRRPV